MANRKLPRQHSTQDAVKRATPNPLPGYNGNTERAEGQTPGATPPPSPTPQADPLADYARPVEPPPAAVPDPVTQLASYMSANQVSADGAPKPPPRVTALAVRKPNDQEYIRVRPGVELFFRLFKLKGSGRLYLFRPEVEPYLNARHVRQYRLVLALPLRAVVPFVWALAVPQDDMGYSWHASADAVARDAERVWMRISADLGGGVYVGAAAEGALPEPVWPEQDFGELV
jgi:hypothetical protein